MITKDIKVVGEELLKTSSFSSTAGFPCPQKHKYFF
jgi:hypothetical protein